MSQTARDAMQAIQDGGGDGKFARAIRGFMDVGPTK